MNEINFNIEDIEKIDLSMDVGIKEIYPPLENLTVEPTKEQQVFNHENSYGYDNITVQPIPDEYIIPEGMLPITENATYDVRKFARVSTSVHPAPNLQDKSITINENGTHSITADEEYDGLNQVDVTVEVEGKEDLTEELTTQDEKITTQETTINDIVEALQGKASGGGSAKLQEKNITITQNSPTNAANATTPNSAPAVATRLRSRHADTAATVEKVIATAANHGKRFQPTIIARPPFSGLPRTSAPHPQ